MLDISYFDALQLQEAARALAWKRFAEDLNWDLSPRDEATEIFARARRWRAPGGFEIVDVRAEAQTLVTDDRRRPNEYWLARLIDGTARVRSQHESLTLAPGDMVFGPLGHRLVFDSAEAMQLEIVHLPRSGRVPRFLASAVLKALQPVRAHTGAARMLGVLLDTFAHAFDTMGEAEVRAIEVAISEFFIASLSAVPDQRDMSASRAVLLSRAHDAIDRHLRDAGISPANVAPLLSISPRYLQKVLSEGGEAFNLYVRRRRLESAYEELMNPVYFRDSISEVCFRWGFNDSAYFSRVFKSHFGIAPSQHRENWKRHDATCTRGEAALSSSTH
ncbi:helix-turn-helix domain-containing protein [Paraburkholderia strydomiana]|uniref:helix-turn-helix domain-containing protein n=1 Tax=Paraburkholderia strydomiana TaxID=1245417 RepID=UPI0038B9ABD2